MFLLTGGPELSDPNGSLRWDRRAEEVTFSASFNVLDWVLRLAGYKDNVGSCLAQV